MYCRIPGLSLTKGSFIHDTENWERTSQERVTDFRVSTCVNYARHVF